MRKKESIYRILFQAVLIVTLKTVSGCFKSNYSISLFQIIQFLLAAVIIARPQGCRKVASLLPNGERGGGGGGGVVSEGL